jgi:hypothetical protein
MSRELTPRPDPQAIRTSKDPADTIRVSKVVLTIGRRRYEMTHTIESREISAGPAEIIEIAKLRPAKLPRPGDPR